MNNKPIVTVCCLAYNHEKYIRQCLDGFVMQKTNFPFEVIVHDDASTDSTPQIIQEYADKYPDIIKPRFQSENQHNKIGIIGIYRDFILKDTISKYCAFCEGDDYWIDSMKLQKQVDSLKKHPKCNIAVHKVQCVDESGKILSSMYPQDDIYEYVIDTITFLSGLTEGRFFHTSSICCNMDLVKKLIKDKPDFLNYTYALDVPLLLYFGISGGVYYSNDSMSCYRQNSNGSWTEKVTHDFNKRVYWKKQQIKMYEEFNNYTNKAFNSLCECWINNEKFMIAEIMHDYKEMVKPQYGYWFKKRNIKFRLRTHILSKF